MKRFLSFITALSLLLMGCEGLGLDQNQSGGGSGGGSVSNYFSAEDLAKLDGVSWEGGTLSLPFTPNADWEAFSRTEWISVSPESGYANQQVTLNVTVDENNTGAVRTGKVYLDLNGLIEIPVKQNAQSGEGGNDDDEEIVLRLVDGSTYSINSFGGDLYVKVETNTKYDVEIATGSSWLSQVENSRTRAVRTDVLKFTAEMNDSGSERTAKVRLVDEENDKMVTFYVEQAVYQNGDEDKEEPKITVSSNFSELSASGGEVELAVYSNASWSASCSTSGVSISPRSGEGDDVVTVSIPETTSAREIRVEFTATLNGKSVNDSVTISQNGVEPELSLLLNDTSNIPATGGEFGISVTSNASWRATCATSGVSISPKSGNGNGSVTVTVPATTTSREIVVKFTANLNGKTVSQSVEVTQSGEEEPTPGELQDYLEKTGNEFLTYFNPEDSRALVTSITDLANNGGFDFELEESTRVANVKNANNPIKQLLTSVMGVARFSPKSAARLSTQLIFPEEGESYNLDDYKGKQYQFNNQTGLWRETSLGNVNKMVAKWDNTVATLTWTEGTSSWEGNVSLDYMAKVKNIPSKLNLEVKIGSTKHFTTTVDVKVPSNYEIDTNTVVWLKGEYGFTVVVKADRKGVDGSVVISKGSVKLASGGGKVAINDLTDSDNWWTEYTEQWFDGYQWHTETYTDFNWDYPVDQVKTGQGYATILDVTLEATGNLRSIIDEGNNIEDIYSRDGARLFCNHINSNASAALYYTSAKKKMADVKAEPMPYEYWTWENGYEQMKTEYEPMPVLIFTDGTKFAVDEYFTEASFGNLIDAAEELWDRYYNLVDNE